MTTSVIYNLFIKEKRNKTRINIVKEIKAFKKIKNDKKDFPDGAVVKNPPANAGDMG